MDTNVVELSVRLRPVSQPCVRVLLNDHIRADLQLTDTLNLDIKFVGSKSATLKIEHYNKQDLDPHTAVVIEEIKFFGISDPKFIWAGVYRPQYPDHYENKIPERPGQGYLGWNGVYSLEFGVPVFTWIHQTLDLGWLYD